LIHQNSNTMTTIKNILTENRDSVISSIKYVFNIWRPEDVKGKMIEFLAYAEKFGDVEKLSTSKRVKSDLKELVCKMNFSQKLRAPKGRSVAEMHADWMIENDLEFDALTKDHRKINM
jgi:hypothetical protein